jgi:hypothetical protein
MFDALLIPSGNRMKGRRKFSFFFPHHFIEMTLGLICRSFSTIYFCLTERAQSISSIIYFFFCHDNDSYFWARHRRRLVLAITSATGWFACLFFTSLSLALALFFSGSNG